MPNSEDKELTVEDSWRVTITSIRNLLSGGLSTAPKPQSSTTTQNGVRTSSPSALEGIEQALSNLSVGVNTRSLSDRMIQFYESYWKYRRTSQAEGQEERQYSGYLWDLKKAILIAEIIRELVLETFEEGSVVEKIAAEDLKTSLTKLEVFEKTGTALEGI